MRRTVKGDQRAMEQLYGLTAKALYNYVRRLGSDAESGEDLLQITFLNAWKSRRSFRGSGARAWLFTIARNAYFRHHRERRRDGDVRLVANEPVTPSQEHAATDLARRIEMVLSQIDSASREAVILSRVSGLSCREIAQVLQISESNVRVRIHRGLTRLKEVLEP